MSFDIICYANGNVIAVAIAMVSNQDEL